MIKESILLFAISLILFSCQGEFKFEKADYDIDNINIPDFISESRIKEYNQKKRIANLHKESAYKQKMKRTELNHIIWEITEQREKEEGK